LAFDSESSLKAIVSDLATKLLQRFRLEICSLGKVLRLELLLRGILQLRLFSLRPVNRIFPRFLEIFCSSSSPSSEDSMAPLPLQNPEVPLEFEPVEQVDKERLRRLSRNNGSPVPPKNSPTTNLESIAKFEDALTL